MVVLFAKKSQRIIFYPIASRYGFTGWDTLAIEGMVILVFYSIFTANITIMTIFDIAKGISWTEEMNILFIPKNETFNILVEYLNDTKGIYWDNDLNQLEQFYEILRSNDKVTIENYFMGRYGFNKYNDGNIYAYLAGANDLGFGVLYSLEENMIIIKHVYSEPYEKFTIKISDLINLLKNKKAIEVSIAH